jgi:hypothetical protein
MSVSERQDRIAMAFPVAFKGAGDGADALFLLRGIVPTGKLSLMAGLYPHLGVVHLRARGDP